MNPRMLANSIPRPENNAISDGCSTVISPGGVRYRAGYGANNALNALWSRDSCLITLCLVLQYFPVDMIGNFMSLKCPPSPAIIVG